MKFHYQLLMLIFSLWSTFLYSLKDECVDGQAFVSITETDLKDLQIKTGPRKRILSLIKMANQLECIVITNVSDQVNETVNNGIQESNTKVDKVTDDSLIKTADTAVPSTSTHEIAKSSKQVKFNLRAWVDENDEKQMRKPSLVSILDSGVVQPNERQELIRIVCAGLAKFNENLYPSSELKTQLARAIIDSFPKLRSTQSAEGYEHFYDRKTNTGFIEFRFKTMRVKLSPSKKRRAASLNENIRKKNMLRKEIDGELLDNEVFMFKISELVYKMPNESNKQDIMRLTDETRPNRQKELKNSDKQMTLANILKTYPRFKDYYGELIQREFIALFPDNDTFAGKFVSFYVPRILKLCSSSKPHLLHEVNDLEDDNLKALLLLPELLPSPNYMQRKTVKGQSKSFAGQVKAKSIESCTSSAKKIPNMNLLQYIHSSEDLLAQNPKSRAKSLTKNSENVQPLLVCNMSGREHKGNFYIKADGNLIAVGDNAITAFDILLKMHYCFDIEFALDLTNFYDFITGCIMNLSQPRACCVALHATMSNMTLDSHSGIDDIRNDNSDDELTSSSGESDE